MKKALLLLMALFLLLAGCANGQAGAPAQYNKAGTRSVSIDEASTPNAVTPDPEEPSNGDLLPSVDAAGAETDVIEIKEKMFIAQTNDVYLNPEEYLGKTIKYEGIFDIYDDDIVDITYYSVIRYGPGCCGNDAYAGFEVTWDKAYPNQDDWVEAVGVLENYEENGSEYLRLRLASLKVLETRGAETVTQ